MKETEGKEEEEEEEEERGGEGKGEGRKKERRKEENRISGHHNGDKVTCKRFKGFALPQTVSLFTAPILVPKASEILFQPECELIFVGIFVRFVQKS
jgi:hypothetical protein